MITIGGRVRISSVWFTLQELLQAIIGRKKIRLLQELSNSRQRNNIKNYQDEIIRGKFHQKELIKVIWL